MKRRTIVGELENATVYTYCSQGGPQMVEREIEMLKMLIEYDASYRTLLQFAGFFDEFLQDADKVKAGEWLLLSWSGITWVEVAWVERKLTPERPSDYKHLPIWERIGYSVDKPLGHVCWEKVGYYDPSTGNLVIGD